MDDATITLDRRTSEGTSGKELTEGPVLTARRLAPLLKAIADEHRLAILLLLAERQCTVVELTSELGVGQTLVSHHLKALRDAGLVAATPVGRSNVYAMCCEAVAEPVRYLAGIAIAAQRANEEELP
jgi:DNA-binding transcriptional ArsR family regulator